MRYKADCTTHVLISSHAVALTVVEQHTVKGKSVVWVWLSEDQVRHCWVVALQPAELIGEDVLWAPKRDVQKPGRLESRAKIF